MKKPASPAIAAPRKSAGPGPEAHRKGVFECTGCGACCRNHGEANYVFVKAPEIARLAKHLGLSDADFRARYTVRVGRQTSLASSGTACIFLVENRCVVQAAKPDQCATWPFWEENIEKGKFTSDMMFCPGIQRLQKELSGKRVRMPVKPAKKRRA
jgi:hypothetical protein